MSMNRNEALSKMAKEDRFVALTAGDVLAGEKISGHFCAGLDLKDRAFFKEHADKPAFLVARACIHGRKWPLDPMPPLPLALKDWRKRAGISQEAAAELIYKTRSTWARYESGELKMDALAYEVFCKRAMLIALEKQKSAS